MEEMREYLGKRGEKKRGKLAKRNGERRKGSKGRRQRRETGYGLTEGPTIRRTDGRTHPHIEMGEPI